jgi:hypothetical protein
MSHHARSSLNLIAISLIFFNNLNILISLLEIFLGIHIQHIKEDYLKLRKKFRGKEWDAVMWWMTKPLSMRDLFSSKQWATMWSTYALFDPSYQNDESFGFFIDVGNGYSTIPACVLINASILFPNKISPTLVGCVAIGSYWQITYGTFIYLLSFMYNKRYKGFKVGDIGLFVGVSNGTWILFPFIGIYAGFVILRDGNLAIFRIADN